MLIVRTAFIGIFGVLPSAFLIFFAVLGAVAGAQAMFTGPHIVGLVLCLWGAAGIWGAVSLLRAMLGNPTEKIRFGLYAGMFAVAPIVISTALDPGLADSPELVVISIAPFLVACFLVTELCGRRLRS